ncbi:unnamed protein product [Amoebophrya sp. A120]|nr:unnamed protein product [Amoebophrya sp. A120]|eukprot:GSA120T00019175001.1
MSTPNIHTDQTSILASQTPTPNLNNEEDNLQLKINNQDETSMLEQTGGTRVAQPIYNLDPNQMKKIEQAVHGQLLVTSGAANAGGNNGSSGGGNNLQQQGGGGSSQPGMAHLPPGQSMSSMSTASALGNAHPSNHSLSEMLMSISGGGHHLQVSQQGGGGQHLQHQNGTVVPGQTTNPGLVSTSTSIQDLQSLLPGSTNRSSQNLQALQQQSPGNPEQMQRALRDLMDSAQGGYNNRQNLNLSPQPQTSPTTADQLQSNSQLLQQLQQGLVGQQLRLANHGNINAGDSQQHQLQQHSLQHHNPQQLFVFDQNSQKMMPLVRNNAGGVVQIGNTLYNLSASGNNLLNQSSGTPSSSSQDLVGLVQQHQQQNSNSNHNLLNLSQQSGGTTSGGHPHHQQQFHLGTNAQGQLTLMATTPGTSNSLHHQHNSTSGNNILNSSGGGTNTSASGGGLHQHAQLSSGLQSLQNSNENMQNLLLQSGPDGQLVLQHQTSGLSSTHPGNNAGAHHQHHQGTTTTTVNSHWIPTSRPIILRTGGVGQSEHVVQSTAGLGGGGGTTTTNHHGSSAGNSNLLSYHSSSSPEDQLYSSSFHHQHQHTAAAAIDHQNRVILQQQFKNKEFIGNATILPPGAISRANSLQNKGNYTPGAGGGAAAGSSSYQHAGAIHLDDLYHSGSKGPGAPGSAQHHMHVEHSFPQPPSPKGAAAYNNLRKSSGGGKHAYKNASDPRNNGDQVQDFRDELWESRNSDQQQPNQQSGRKSRGKKGNRKDSGSKGNSRGSRNEPRSSVEQDQLDFDVDNDADWPAVILPGKQDPSTTRGSSSGGKQGMKPGAFQHLEHDPYYFHTNPVFEQFYDWERLEQMRAIQQQQGAAGTGTGGTSAGQYPGTSSAAAGGNFQNHVAHHAPLPPVPPPAMVPPYHGGAPGVDLAYGFAPGTRTTSGGRGYGKSGPDPLMDRKGSTSKQGAADGGKNNSRGGSKGGGGGPPPNRNRKGSGGGKQGGSTSFGANQDGVGGTRSSSSSSSSARNSTTGPLPKLGNNELLHQRSSGSSKDNKSDGHGRNHSKKQGRVQLHEGSGSRRDNSKRESKMSSLDTNGGDQDHIIDAAQGNVNGRRVTHHRGIEYKHNKVPRNKDLLAEYGQTLSEKPITTLMIRNIPNRYTQPQFVQELDNIGFAKQYDFVYLPIDRSTESSVGYAFVNFKKAADSVRALSVFGEYRFHRYRNVSSKVGSVSIAHIQGLENNIAHYKKSVINDTKNRFRPLVIRDAKQMREQREKRMLNNNNNSANSKNSCNQNSDQLERLEDHVDVLVEEEEENDVGSGGSRNASRTQSKVDDSAKAEDTFANKNDEDHFHASSKNPPKQKVAGEAKEDADENSAPVKNKAGSEDMLLLDEPPEPTTVSTKPQDDFPEPSEAGQQDELASMYEHNDTLNKNSKGEDNTQRSLSETNELGGAPTAETATAGEPVSCNF